MLCFFHKEKGLGKSFLSNIHNIVSKTFSQTYKKGGVSHEKNYERCTCSFHVP